MPSGRKGKPRVFGKVLPGLPGPDVVLTFPIPALDLTLTKGPHRLGGHDVEIRATVPSQG
ncbi:hypothetical protein GCM10011509_29960 [Ornithinimicrobium pekingense]|uniref:Uncharacterized protein n=1 Tax=Ornithinimicrobium pekingense TaxID=384677 RepID=A0ABQ2FB69_9MICO|nr:hypothetical protein GCM10011509_29960 [Ornithinimicrobium pekingense]